MSIYYFYKGGFGNMTVDVVGAWRQKEYGNGADKRHDGINGVLKYGGRNLPDDNITDNTAADRRHKTHHRNTENIHFHTLCLHGTRYGKSHRADKLHNQNIG